MRSMRNLYDGIPKIISNRARCRKCGDFLESLSVHDFKTCSCGAISIDGGLVYLRRIAQDMNDLEELSEVVKPKALTYIEVLHLKHEPIIITHTEKGTWEDQARPVESFMDMNTLPLESGVKLDLDEFGTVWNVYLMEE